MKSTAEILEAALQVPAPERARLAAALLRSLDEGADTDAEEAWDAEIAARLRELDAGKAESISIEEFEEHVRTRRAAWAAARASRG